MRRHDQTTVPLACERGYCALDLDTAMDVHGGHLDVKRRRHRLGRLQHRYSGHRIRTEKHGYPAHVGRDLFEHPKPFAPYGGLEILETADIPTWSRKAGDESTADWFGDLREHNRDHTGEPFQLGQRRPARDHDHIRS